MNWKHFSAIVWLRWRLAVNQIRRQSLLTRLVSFLTIFVALLCSVGAFLSTFATGMWLLPDEPPWWLVYAWDGLIAFFLVSWIAGVATELQQSEVLSLEKFLHLPVSTSGIVGLNYLGSLISLNLVMFVPSMLAFATVIAVRYGGFAVFSPLLVLAFIVMITAVTWQFRGWLAMLMSDKRRKRTIVAVGTLALVSVAFLPAFLDNTFSGEDEVATSRRAVSRQLADLELQSRRGEIPEEERAERAEKIVKAREKSRAARLAGIRQWTDMGNAVLPFGWLPHGIRSATEGNGLATFLCLAGMTSIGGYSLVRSWRTAIKTVTGGHVLKHAVPKTVVVVAEGASKSGEIGRELSRKPNWLERSWPFLTEQQSAVAMLTLRGLARAPEAKLALFWPVVVLVLLGGTSAMGNKWNVPVDMRPLSGIGICFFIMMGATQLIQNQFGFDRDGFRLGLLVPLSERDHLTGKNMALAPLAFLLGLVALVAVQFFAPMRFTHFVATFFQLGTMYLVSCLVGNLISILVPLAVKHGSMKPVNLKFGAAILQIVIFLLAPLGMIPALAPLGVEYLVRETEPWNSVPIYLICTIGYFLVMLWVYHRVVGWQGELLFRRRHQILETVTNVEG